VSKKHFIALADMIIRYNRPPCYHGQPFTEDQLKALASFCSDQNSRFDYQRWISYINGECGPNGGKANAR
jgi:hypothetical protein